MCAEQVWASPDISIKERVVVTGSLLMRGSVVVSRPPQLFSSPSWKHWKVAPASVPTCSRRWRRWRLAPAWVPRMNIELEALEGFQRIGATTCEADLPEYVLGGASERCNFPIAYRCCDHLPEPPAAPFRGGIDGAATFQRLQPAPPRRRSMPPNSSSASSLLDAAGLGSMPPTASSSSSRTP